jgi:ribose transport system permease protein
MTRISSWTADRPWLWSWVGAVLLWLAIIALAAGEGAGEVLSTAFSFGVFFIVVAIGQMFVIAMGPGNIDLSIPANIALSGSVGMIVMAGQDGLVLPGLAAALACGLAVGIANWALIRGFAMPPIIATLSSSLVFQSVAIAYSRGLRIAPPDGFAAFTTSKPWGIPVMAVAGIVLAAIMSVILHRTVYGRSVLAVGQNPRAAHLAGVRVERTRFITYALSGGFAGLAGALMAGYFGGASLDMGKDYLLNSIAVVVIGGTSVAGGRANLPGLWGAALFLFLLVTMLNTMGVGTGLRLVLTGLIIIAVIVAAGGEKTR